MEKFRLLASIIEPIIIANIKNKIDYKFSNRERYYMAQHVFVNIRKRMRKSSIVSMCVHEILKDTLTNYEIIEVHNLKGSVRALVRSQNVYGDGNACFVLDLDTDAVVTCYFNKFDDEHKTIDMNNYFGKYSA